MNDPVWITKEGITIPFSKLSDRHLDNIIAMVRRKHNELSELVAAPPCFQGEMAQYYAERDWNIACKEEFKVQIILTGLIAERDRRRAAH